MQYILVTICSTSLGALNSTLKNGSRNGSPNIEKSKNNYVLV